MRRIEPIGIRSSVLAALVFITTGNVLPIAVAAAAENHPLTIGEYVKSGRGSVHLVGDGHNTDHCQLILTSAKSGKSASTTISTVCAAKENQKAPPTTDQSAQDKLRYTVAAAVDPNLVGIAKAADKLSADDMYKHLMINPHNRKRAIAQLAIWQYNGEKDPEAQVTTQTVRSDLMKKAHLTPKDLRGDNKKVFDGAVDDLFLAVDLTRKVGLTMAAPPKKDEDKPEPPQPQAPTSADNPPSGAVPIPAVALVVKTDTDKPTSNDASPSHSDGAQTPHGVLIPAYTLFEASDAHYQNMMTLDDDNIDDPDDDTVVAGGLPPGVAQIDNGNGNGPQVAVAKPKKKKQCAWVFRDYKKVDFGKGLEAAGKIKAALEKFVEKAAEWGEMATGVTDAIDKLGPQSGLCEIELIYLCVVTDPGDEDVQVGEVMGEKVVILTPGTDVDATDFQHGKDAGIRKILDMPKKELTTPKNRSLFDTYMEWTKIWEQHKPKGNCCCN